MLSRPGPLPSGPSWSFELKWDGFRALVSTEDGLRVQSRRGWNMTGVLPELRGLPSGLVLDGELVAWKGSEPSVRYRSSHRSAARSYFGPPPYRGDGLSAFLSRGGGSYAGCEPVSVGGGCFTMSAFIGETGCFGATGSVLA
jgi:hypothetical protein